MKIAAVNWELLPISTLDEFENHLTDILMQCVTQGAETIVLPEYTIGEILSTLPHYEESEAPRVLVPFGESYCRMLQHFARSNAVRLVGGTYFKAHQDLILNVCPIVSSDGSVIEQPKNCLVEYERSVQKLSGIQGLHLFNNSSVGVLICYDSEFPEAARALCEAEIKVLAVPSSTETIHGFHRVRSSCIARAVENQIYVVHSALVGSIGKEPFPESYGSSAIISPAMPEFPSGPIVAESKLNTQGIVVADLDLDLIDRIRENGEVRNWQDRNRSTWGVTKH